jgi:hypothetical protein
MRAVVTLEFEPTVAGIREGRTALDRLESLLSGGESTTTPTPVAPGAPDVVAVYERCEPELRSRELLELLPGDEPGLTPEEIADELAPDEKGETLTKDSVRAILRNIARAEGSLLKDGAIADHIIVKNFDEYEREGAGRYSLRREDRDALDRHLGR